MQLSCFCYMHRILSFFANTLQDAKNLMNIFKNFCMHSNISVNSSKEKVLHMDTQNNYMPCIVYKNEPHETIMSHIKYPSLDGPSNHTWNECVIYWRTYQIKCWVLKKYLFDILITLVLSLWGWSMWQYHPLLLEISKSVFIWSFFESKKKWLKCPFPRLSHLQLGGHAHA